MSTENTLEKTIAGGWTKYHSLTADDRAVFDEAMNGFVGVKYNPQSVATQVVQGTNYRFRSEASMPPTEVTWEAVVEIYKPLEGKPYITGITRL